MKISAIIIATNSEELIGECIDSVSWVDEIVVVDHATDDNTVKIAKEKDAKVYKYPRGGTFSDWRNFGAKKANCPWVLYLDVDERITPLLRKEILSVINSPERFVAYAIPRRNFVLGKELKHGGLWPDYVKRLFKKDMFHGWSGELHEEPHYQVRDEIVTGGKGKIGHLTNPLIHFKHNSLSEMVEKTNNWSEIEAKLMFEANHPPMNIFRFSTAAIREFWLRFVRQLAFLDGTEGVIYGIYQIYSRLISYAKLWEMQIKAKNL